MLLTSTTDAGDSAVLAALWKSCFQELLRAELNTENCTFPTYRKSTEAIVAQNIYASYLIRCRGDMVAYETVAVSTWSFGPRLRQQWRQLLFLTASSCDPRRGHLQLNEAFPRTECFFTMQPQVWQTSACIGAKLFQSNSYPSRTLSHSAAGLWDKLFNLRIYHQYTAHCSL